MPCYCHLVARFGNVRGSCFVRRGAVSHASPETSVSRRCDVRFQVCSKFRSLSRPLCFLRLSGPAGGRVLGSWRSLSPSLGPSVGRTLTVGARSTQSGKVCFSLYTFSFSTPIECESELWDMNSKYVRYLSD